MLEESSSKPLPEEDEKERRICAEDQARRLSMPGYLTRALKKAYPLGEPQGEAAEKSTAGPARLTTGTFENGELSVVELWADFTYHPEGLLGKRGFGKKSQAALKKIFAELSKSGVEKKTRSTRLSAWLSEKEHDALRELAKSRGRSLSQTAVEIAVDPVVPWRKRVPFEADEGTKKSKELWARFERERQQVLERWRRVFELSGEEAKLFAAEKKRRSKQVQASMRPEKEEVFCRVAANLKTTPSKLLRAGILMRLDVSRFVPVEGESEGEQLDGRKKKVVRTSLSPSEVRRVEEAAQREGLVLGEFAREAGVRILSERSGEEEVNRWRGMIEKVGAERSILKSAPGSESRSEHVSAPVTAATLARVDGTARWMGATRAQAFRLALLHRVGAAEYEVEEGAARIAFRVSKDEKAAVERAAKENGFEQAGGFVTDVVQRRLARQGGEGRSERHLEQIRERDLLLGAIERMYWKAESAGQGEEPRRSFPPIEQARYEQLKTSLMDEEALGRVRWLSARLLVPTATLARVCVLQESGALDLPG